MVSAFGTSINFAVFGTDATQVFLGMLEYEREVKTLARTVGFGLPLIGTSRAAR